MLRGPFFHSERQTGVGKRSTRAKRRIIKRRKGVKKIRSVEESRAPGSPELSPVRLCADALRVCDVLNTRSQTVSLIYCCFFICVARDNKSNCSCSAAGQDPRTWAWPRLANRETLTFSCTQKKKKQSLYPPPPQTHTHTHVSFFMKTVLNLKNILLIRLP